VIKINLTPDEELENPLWWVPDVLLAVTVALCGFFAGQYYLSDSKNELQRLNKEIVSLEEGAKAMVEDVKKYDELEKDHNALKSKLESLAKLTASEVVRYKPLILLEHLQNLSPVGLWFRTISFMKKDAAATPAAAPAAGAAAAAPADEEITISGFAFDNILVAEFLAALRATQTQDVDPKDLRTHVYFSTVKLVDSKLEPSQGMFLGENITQSSATGTIETNLERLPHFQVILEIKEHAIDKPAPTVAFLDLPFLNDRNL